MSSNQSTTNDNPATPTAAPQQQQQQQISDAERWERSAATFAEIRNKPLAERADVPNHQKVVIRVLCCSFVVNRFNFDEIMEKENRDIDNYLEVLFTWVQKNQLQHHVTREEDGYLYMADLKYQKQPIPPRMLQDLRTVPFKTMERLGVYLWYLNAIPQLPPISIPFPQSALNTALLAPVLNQSAEAFLGKTSTRDAESLERAGQAHELLFWRIWIETLVRSDVIKREQVAERIKQKAIKMHQEGHIPCVVQDDFPLPEFPNNKEDGSSSSSNGTPEAATTTTTTTTAPTRAFKDATDEELPIIAHTLSK
eukprot:GEZU01026036.1.p1 GENE.GEZU01026036.1~~GEZU01026036.1.p1  ORF type:complete len:310 (-),score=103.21 GEZU01026036.1:20-949(-)